MLKYQALTMKTSYYKIFKPSISKPFWLLLLCILYSSATSVGASPAVQISGQMVANGDISTYLISADGETVVYSADQDVDGVDELYKVPKNGGPAIKLNTALPLGSNVMNDFIISPDSGYVIYRVTQGAFYDELYRVSLTGGNAVKISSKARSGTKGFEISNDSSRIVYRDSQNEFGRDELYSMSLFGGFAIKINRGSERILDFKISPDSVNVVYKSDYERNNFYELFSVPIDGGSTVKLSQLAGQAPEIGTVLKYEFTFDGMHVVYVAAQDEERTNELYIVATSGGAIAKLNLPLDDFQSVSSAFSVSPDDNYVVYSIDDTIVNDEYQLYSVSIEGGASVKLTPALVPDGTKVYHYVVSPDSKHVVYISNHQNVEIDELYSVPIEGGAIVKLNSPITAGNNTNVFNNFLISSDNTRVVYRSRQSDGDPLEIFSVPIEGGAPNKLHSGFAQDSGTQDGYIISANSTRVIYLRKGMLFSAPIAGGFALTLNDNLPERSRVDSFLLNAESSYIVYLADQDVYDEHELFSRPLPTIEEHIDDADGDGIDFADDNCPNLSNGDQEDSDSDGEGDVCDADIDGDNIANGLDNCPIVTNHFQLDTDGDEQGDLCDEDDDNDGVRDGLDSNSTNPNICSDIDSDLCDDCSIGVDQFGFADDFDVSNDGVDTDSDGNCDLGDSDDDGDLISDSEDNCSLIPNPDQTDINDDGVGDECSQIDELCFPVKISMASLTIVCL